MRITQRQLLALFHESNLIEGYDDLDFDAQSMVAWNHLVLLGIQDLEPGDIMKIQKIITLRQTDLQPDWRGYYRKIPVYIGGKEAPPAGMVKHYMDNWLIDLRTGEWDAKKMHVAFEHIHPFVDGNGRTGRMLMWWQQFKLDQPLTKLTAEKRQEYYAWFQ